MQESSKSVCDRPIFTEVFEKHAIAIRNFIYYKCGDKEQAEDVMQEAFIKLWDNCKKVLFEKTKPFLCTVANNIFLNQVARKKVRLEYTRIAPRNKNTESPDFVLEEKEFMDTLQNAIADLSEAQREVFLLNRIDQKTYVEIAEMLGISVKAVEKRMHNALKQLRKLVKGI
ncbi:RNA polymerase sigma factor [Aquimarina sp. AD10]|uniref:RNA polymerase subunit sigma-70 n=1 Tax=Aquimarina aggregata TaxID=1642818 RepID=A0A163BF73_9FLAO|nr:MULTISPECIES: RNA polymerase sigma factor [Aquimarina]AXT61730.1 RNA polymerase sigma factor [Aquimarina sp. AD10]KZS41332.1 RNA polymerase subunit sigma-70 [Aquimarina aggregata]RKN00920.1 RNA polymerase sigma factor [Aquimarina sp. AD10]